MKFIAGLVTALLIVMSAAMIAQADIPDSTTGDITACLNADHAMRVIDAEASATCETGETEISWSSGGITVINDYDSSDQSINATPATVASISVPAGTWLIQAKAWILQGTSSYGGCYVSGVDRSDETPGTMHSVALLNTYTVGTTTTLNLDCFAGGSSAVARNSSIVATEVG